MMITGSHNPPDYNGFKISVGQTTMFGSEIQELKHIISAKDYFSGQGAEEKYDILTPYVERYKKEFAGIKNIPFVLDCGNGAGGSIVKAI